MSVPVEWVMSVTISTNSVLSDAGMEVKGTKDIVQECLRQFPYIWASFDSFNLWYMSHERV